VSGDFKQIDYLNAISNIVGPKNMISAGKAENKLTVFLSNEVYANTLIQNGITMNNQLILVFPITKKPTRMVLSNMNPLIPEKQIMEFIKTFGKTTTDYLKPIPLNTNGNEELTQMISHRRELYIHLNQNAHVPRRFYVQKNDINWAIDINMDLFCQNCKVNTHDTINCVNKRLQRCNKCEQIGHDAAICPSEFPGIVTTQQNSATNQQMNSNNDNNQNNLQNQNQLDIFENLHEKRDLHKRKLNETVSSNEIPQKAKKFPMLNLPFDKKNIENAENVKTASQKNNISVQSNFSLLDEDQNNSMIIESVDDDDNMSISSISSRDSFYVSVNKENNNFDYLKNILKKLKNQKSVPKKIETINEYTKDYKKMLNDLDELKIYNIHNHTNAININQRIDRLQTFININIMHSQNKQDY
jgi:hypothetical protein